MEYVDGTSLRKLIHSRPISLEAALIIVGQMLQALEYAHHNQVIHRDIKPENVMISAQHGVKIIDFGIAKVLSTVTRTRDGMLLGTPEYMSYEQAMGQPVTPASDIYATAIVLYELLTTKVPFTADNSIEIVQMHQAIRPAPPSQINPAIPPAVEAAILRALEKDQQARFRSAIEFAMALGCPLGSPLPADVATAVSRLAPPAPAQPGRAADVLAHAPATPPAPPTPHSRRAMLRIESGPRRGQIIPLGSSQVIGRMEINPSDETISRQHFRLEQQYGGYVVFDISTHGTVINGDRLRGGNSQPLQHGTKICVGQTFLIYENS
jgi:eukaryotic-like serine/threonine-protein kinase